MHKRPVWEDHVTVRTLSRIESLAQQPEATCLTTQDPITPSPAPPSPCSWAPSTKADQGAVVTLLGSDKECFATCRWHLTPPPPGTSCPQRVQFPKRQCSWPLPAAPQLTGAHHLSGETQAGPQTSLTLTAARCSWDSSGLHRSS